MRPFKTKLLNRIKIISELLYTVSSIVIVSFPVLENVMTIDTYKNLGWLITFLYSSVLFVEVSYLAIDFY